MGKLRAYLNSLSTPAQIDFAIRCGTSIGYLRKAMSTGQRLGEWLCINIERESKRQICCEDLRSDVDWAYLRNSSMGPPSSVTETPRSSVPEPVHECASGDPRKNIDRRHADKRQRIDRRQAPS